jgi:small-conductance mechanosensitive channel
MTVGNSESWLVAIGVAAGVWIVGWLAMRLLLAWLPRLLKHSRTQVDDLLFSAVRPHLPLWFLALGLVIGARRAPIPDTAFLWIDRVVMAVVILSAALALASFLVGLLRNRATPGLALMPSNTLVENSIRFGIVGLALLAILGEMGVAITPLLTALGVGSLALALALQPTLSNLFAGFHITMARLIRIGDYVELDSGQRGYVVDINWRSTLIRELADNTVVLPNARLAEMTVRNYSLPDEEHSVAVNVTVAFGADLEKVERVAREAALEIQRTAEGAVPDAVPGVQFLTYQDSGVQLGIFPRVRRARDRARLVHELIKLLHRRFREEGIEIPLPQRVVHIPGTGGVAPRGAGPPPDPPVPGSDLQGGQLC